MMTELVTDSDWGLTTLILSCAVGSYVWRGLGVWVADRVNVESDWFRWITCVAFAMIAGLVCRVVVLPVGELEHTSLLRRLVGVAVAVIVFRMTKKGLLAGVLAGAATLPILGHLGWG
jgi:branched-subunit amino acid transport protein